MARSTDTHCPAGDCAAIAERGKLHDDLCDLGEDISPNRAWRLARLAGIRAHIGYKKKPGSYGGSPAVVADIEPVNATGSGPLAGAYFAWESPHSRM